MSDMSDGNPHGVDAHIPSDTEQFDEMAENQPLTESQLKLAAQVKRLTQLSRWLLGTKGAAGNMLVETHINMNLMRCEIMALTNFIEKRFKVDSEEMTQAVCDEIERHLAMYQINYKAIFTPDGVIEEPDPNATSNQQHTGSEQGHDGTPGPDNRG